MARAAIIWSAKTDQTIRTMRAAGALWNEIGAAIGGSGDAVVKRAKLLGVYEPPGIVTDRAAALIRAQKHEEKRNAAVRAHHAAKVAERAKAKALGVSPERLANRIASAIAQSNRKAEPPPPRAVTDYAKPIPHARTCQWPLNSGRPWLFCDSASILLGKPYCAVHQALACVPPATKRKQEDAG